MADNQVKRFSPRESMDLSEKIIDSVIAVGGDDTDLRRLLGDSCLLKRVAEVIARKEIDRIYPTKIRCGMSYEERLKSCGFEDPKRSISKPWEMAETGPLEVELRLVRYEYMVERKLQPAGIEHLLDFAFQYPDEMGDYEVVALASTWVSESNDQEYSSYLVRCRGRRTLSHYWSLHNDKRDSRFLVINP